MSDLSDLHSKFANVHPRVLHGGAHWRNQTNTIQPFMCGGDAAILSDCSDPLLLFPPAISKSLYYHVEANFRLDIERKVPNSVAAGHVLATSVSHYRRLAAGSPPVQTWARAAFVVQQAIGNSLQPPPALFTQLTRLEYTAHSSTVSLPGNGCRLLIRCLVTYNAGAPARLDLFSGGGGSGSLLKTVGYIAV